MLRGGYVHNGPGEDIITMHNYNYDMRIIYNYAHAVLAYHILTIDQQNSIRFSKFYADRH